MALTFENVRKRFLASSPAAQYAVAIGGAGAAALSVLALMYPDRALFDEARPDIPQRAGYPLVGSLPDLIRHVDTFHHFALQGFENVARTTCVRFSDCYLNIKKAFTDSLFAAPCLILVYREMLPLRILAVLSIF
jgi:hypothetical protein